MRWNSFDGCNKEIEDLDDQHLSNIVWYYFLLVPNSEIKDRTLVTIYNEITRRFGEFKILPYRPMVDFTREIEALKDKGYIKGIGLNEDIIVDGEVIGQVVQGIQTSKFKFV